MIFYLTESRSPALLDSGSRLPLCGTSGLHPHKLRSSLELDDIVVIEQEVLGATKCHCRKPETHQKFLFRNSHFGGRVRNRQAPVWPNGGRNGNRTRDRGFADLCLTAWLSGRKEYRSVF